MASESAAHLKIWAARASIVVALTLISTKLWATTVSGSEAMLGSLADSALDLVASLINLVAVTQAQKPADTAHSYGHEKAEAISGMLQSILIFAAASLLVVEGIRSVYDSAPISHAKAGIAVSLLAIFLTTLLVSFQAWVISQTQSVSLHADHVHYKGDVLLNGAVITVFIAPYLLDAPWLDGAVAIGIGLYLAYNIYPVLKRSASILMDTELDHTQRAEIEQIIQEHAGVLGYHDLRTRTSGTYIFIQVHIDLDGTQPLTVAHQITDTLEQKIRSSWPKSEIIIHQDPV